MTIEKALFSLLKDETILSLVPGGIHRSKVPQGTVYPQITFTIVDDPHDYHSSGVTRLKGCNLDVRCRTETASEADVLKNAVTNKLSAFNGTIDDVEIQLITYEGNSEGTERAAAGSETMINVTSQDFDVKYFG